MSAALVVNLVLLALAGFLLWWFWLARPRAQRAAAEPVEILVEGGVYTPARIAAQAGQPLCLRFVRRDPAPCAEQVLFPTLGVVTELPLGAPVTVMLLPPAGDHPFTCQMQMYRGVLEVR